MTGEYDRVPFDSGDSVFFAAMKEKGENDCDLLKIKALKVLRQNFPKKALLINVSLKSKIFNIIVIVV